MAKGFNYRSLNAPVPRASKRAMDKLLERHVPKLLRRRRRNGSGQAELNATLPPLKRPIRLASASTKLLCVALRYGSLTDFTRVR